LIRCVAKLGHGLGGVSVGKNLNWSSTLPTTTIGVVGTPQMVFTNLIMTNVNRTIDWPLMNPMVVRGYKSANVVNPRGGYWKPFAVIASILDHRDGHYVGLNKVAFKYLDFKKDANPDVQIRVFNYVIKANVKTSKECFINAFNYMLTDITLDRCHKLHVRIPWLYFFEANIGILQMSLENLEWQANIHGVEEYEAGGD
jgi:hypothetical protein